MCVGALRPESDGADARTRRTASLLGTRDRRPRRRSTTAMSRPDDLAAILYTSGTTGRSKGAMLTHRNLAQQRVDARRITGDSRAATCCCTRCRSITCTGCSSPATARCSRRRRMLWLPKFDAEEVRALLPHATVMMGVPTFYTRLLAEPAFGAADCRTIRLFISGSAPLLPETFDEFRERTGHTILERYGMTETGMNTSNPLDGERIGGTVGPALPGVAVRVVDGDGAPCRAGAVGAIEVKGPNVFAGYWRMPEKTREEFTADGYFRTGDMGDAAAERLPAHRRAREGPDHHRRPQRLPEGDRGEDRRDAGRGRIGGDRRARRRLRRGGHGRRRARRGPCADRGAASSPRSRRRSRASRCPSACTSSTSCRATRWARSRRTCCASASIL